MKLRKRCSNTTNDKIRVSAKKKSANRKSKVVPNPKNNTNRSNLPRDSEARQKLEQLVLQVKAIKKQR